MSSGKVVVDNVEIKDLETGRSFIVSDAPVKTKLSINPDGRSSAYYCSNKLKLEYNRYSVSFDLLIETDVASIRERVMMNFEKDYKEHKSNKYWDILMGV